MITLSQIRSEIRKKGDLVLLDRHNLSHIVNSPDFKRYWREQVSYEFKEIDKLIKEHSPEQKPIAFWCIAGGAVANVILSYLQESVPVINDIDIFVWIKGQQLPVERYFRTNKVKFAGVERIGRFNIIYKEDKELGEYKLEIPKRERDRKFRDLVSEFDYNACMAYFHPYAEKTSFEVLTPFCQFIREKKLKIYNFHHPLLTLVRGVKKEKELGAQFDRAKIVEVLANLFSEIEIEKTHLGEKKKAEFSDNPQILTPWFILDEEKKVFKSVVNPDVKINYTDKKYHEIFSFFRLPKRQRERLLFLINHKFFYFNKVYRLVNSVKVSIPDFNKDQMLRLKPFMEQHGSRIPVNPLYVKEWLTLVKKIKKENNLEFIGYCENYFCRIEEEQDSEYYKNIHCFDFKELKEKFLKTLEQEKNEVLTEPIGIPQEFQSSIVELIHAYDLKVEGFELQHCVGGYTWAVKEGSSKIFRIRFNDEKATLELKPMHYDGVEKLVINQLRGKNNSEVSDSMRALVNNFVKKINKQDSLS